MTDALTLNQLAEAATIELSEQGQPEGFEASKRIVHSGGSVGGIWTAAWKTRYYKSECIPAQSCGHADD